MYAFNVRFLILYPIDKIYIIYSNMYHNYKITYYTIKSFSYLKVL